ncbi:endonuclease domain-containing protein [Antrihabitans cavernicola]|uniref:DUF559 domain-containing protein n=1 Tax=Antrihabitans cavernicola TaxID=2495913 RepID=A0A5A7S2B2_9NOCA|nr:DUF559 domain-containing protein [Spelaeibacter cavernicola]KAA0017067.1 DUF559 domain-containing protein [Spelaeibacter cavernicola]
MGELGDPFPGSWAVKAGTVTQWELRKDFCRIHPDVYVRKGTELDARIRALAAGHWAKGAGVLVGLSAAAMLGTRWLGDEPAELVKPGTSRAPAGIIVRRDELLRDETCCVAGFTVTTPARTAFDIGRRAPFEKAVVVVDALMNATRTTPSHIADLAARHPGARGIRHLLRVLDVADGGAESPRETLTRLLLIEAGLPRPETQLRIVGHDGFVVARADLGWREWNVIVEYDGAQHWNDRRQRSWDIDRTAILESMGWKVVRVSAELLDSRPWVVIDRVRRALAAAGADV